MNWSFALIAKNEEKTLPRLLCSLKEFKERGGVVVLLDTGSTDKTAEVARNWGCQVHEVGDKFITTIDRELADRINAVHLIEGEKPIVEFGDRLFDYSAARNYVAELAPTDMIAMPDCDEVWTKLDLDTIERTINEGADQLEYNFVFSHDQFGNEAIKFLHSKFYNRKKMKWVGIIHEVLQGDGKRVFLPESVMKLEHYQNHETNRGGYLKGLALDCYRNPLNDRNSHYFGRELMYTGRPHSAIQEFGRHLGLSKWKAERGQSMIFIGDCQTMIGQDEFAIEWYMRGYNEEPQRREGLIRLAEYFYKKNDHLRTAVYAEACLPIKEIGFYANNHEHYTHRPHELLYWAYWYLGDKEKSRYHWDKCYEFQPQNEKFIREAKFYYEFPKVSVVVPNYKRDVTPLLDSLANDNYLGDKEIIVQRDEVGEGCPKTFNKGVERATGLLIVYLGDDTRVERNWLNHAVIKWNQTGKDKLVALNDNILHHGWHPKLADHFLAPKDLREQLVNKTFFDERFKHYGCDDYLTKQAMLLNKYAYAENAKIVHETKEGDETHQKANQSIQEDRELCSKLLAELEGVK